MPMFRVAHGALEWQHIKNLIELETPENELLDYKAADPSQIERVIAAMANTYGGDIIVGVSEQDDGRPEPLSEVRGVREAARVKQAIEQKNFSIHPPVLGLSVQEVPIPQCEHPDKQADFAVVVVRIPQSDLVPHFLAGRGHFRRAGSHGRSYRDEHMATEMITWLADRRRRHVEFRDDLLRQLDEFEGSPVWHKVWCVPQFPSPSTPLWEATESDLWQAMPRLCCRWDEPRPFFRAYFATRPSGRSVQHGVLWSESLTDPVASLSLVTFRPSQICLVDDRGLIGVRGISTSELAAPISDLGEPEPPCGVFIDWTLIAIHLIGVSRYAYGLYTKNGYSGPVQFGVEIGCEHTTVGDYPVFLGIRDKPRGPYVTPPEGPRSQIRETSHVPMAPAGRCVVETHECLVHELPAKVRQALTRSDWTRAFDYRLRADMSEYIRTLEAAFEALPGW